MYQYFYMPTYIKVALFNTNNGQIGIRVTEYESGCLFEKKIGYNILNIYGKNNSMHTSVPIKKSFRSMLDHLTNSSKYLPYRRKYEYRIHCNNSRTLLRPAL